jgi:hypothetical protein
MIDAVESASRIGRLDRERVVDHERRCRRRMSVDAVGRYRADQRNECGEWYEPGDAPGGNLPHYRLQMWLQVKGGL